MQYIASLFYGKDSCAMLEVIHQHNMPLDRIVHVEIKDGEYKTTRPDTENLQKLLKDVMTGLG